MTQVAVADFGKQMQQAEPTFVPKKLIYRMSQADYQKRFGNNYQRPGFFTRVFAFFLKLVPKVGPLKDLALRVPSADAQKIFLSGMDTVVDHYQHSISTLSTEPADHPSLHLPPVNLDTGKPTSSGSYPLADQTYARYLALLVKPRAAAPPPPPSAPWPGPQPADNARPASSPTPPAPAAPTQPQTAQPAAAQPKAPPTLQPVDPAVRADIEHFFANAQSHRDILHLKKDQWKHLPQQLQTLRQLPAAAPAITGAPLSQP
jgi:hypothetical protein